MLTKFQIVSLMMIGLCLGSSIVSWVLFSRQESVLQAVRNQVELLQEEKAEVSNGSTAIPSPKIETTGSSKLSASVSSQIQKVESEVTQLDARLDKIELTKSAPVQTKQVTVNQTSGAKEAVIFLGSGQTYNREWTDVLGTNTTINTQNYTKIKAVYFEANIAIEGGEAFARLVNKTTGGIYFDSEVKNNMNIARWITAGPLYLSPASNEYEVQIRSSSGELAQLQGARIRIVME
jgi:hypothetical protein